MGYPGQGLVEYSLIILLVTVVVTAVLVLLGPQLSNAFSRINSSLLLPSQSAQESDEEPDNTTPPYLSVLSDIQQRMLEYYVQNGKWPRSWGDYAFTDIGLDPVDWASPVEGIYWSPHGSNIGLANRSGDEYQIYVNDAKSGKTLHLYDGWNIWCDVLSSKCYYHTIAPGQEIDISTLVVVKK